MLLNSLDATGQWLVHTVGWLSLEIIVLTCVVYWATRSRWIRSSRVKRWLWRLVLAKPLVALALGWPIELPTAGPDTVAPFAATARTTNSAHAIVEDPPLNPLNRGASPSVAATIRHTVVRDVGPKVSRFAVLAILWLSGAACMAGYSSLGAVWLDRGRRRWYGTTSARSARAITGPWRRVSPGPTRG